MSRFNRNLIIAAVEKYGNAAQLDILQEECCELAVAMSHFRRGRVSRSEVLAEIGDVYLNSKPYPLTCQEWKKKMNALELLNEERQRQEQHGFTSEHDDKHKDGELAFAACYYAMPCMLGRRCDNGKPCPITPDDFFRETGWEQQYARRADKTPLRRTVIAAALLLAEIDRRLRLGEKP